MDTMRHDSTESDQSLEKRFISRTVPNAVSTRSKSSAPNPSPLPFQTHLRDCQNLLAFGHASSSTPVIPVRDSVPPTVAVGFLSPIFLVFRRNFPHNNRMRALFAPLTIVITLLTASCSKPEGATTEDAESESPFENATVSSFPDPDSTVPGELPAVQTFAQPNLELTGPVHESPGIVDNQEARVAVDLLKMENGPAKSLALTELFQRWAEDDLDAAMGMLPYLVNDIENKRAFFRGVAPQLLEQDPERLLAITKEHWWQGQFEAYVQSMTKIADSNLDLAIESYTSTTEGRQYPGLAEKIAGNLMVDRSLEEAEAFAMSIERPEARGMAVEGIVERWTRQDPFAAATYVDDISDPAVKDYAIRGLIRRTANHSPEESFVWTMTMREGDVRMGAVKHLARRWGSGREPEFLERLIGHPGLTEGERDAVRESAGE